MDVVINNILQLVKNCFGGLISTLGGECGSGTIFNLQKLRRKAVRVRDE